MKTTYLSRAYFELGKLGARSVGEKRHWPHRPNSMEELLSICGGMARFDPRLFEVLLQTIVLRWQDIDWLKLRRIVLQSRDPQIFAVIGEFLSSVKSDPEILNCFRYLTHGMKPVSPQLFYHNLYTPGSRMAQRATDKRLREFEKWGFLASERPSLNADTKETAGTLSRSARLHGLKRLLTANTQVRLQDYLAMLPQPISRQQALADLRTIPGLRRKGHGRGARWYVKGMF